MAEISTWCGLCASRWFATLPETNFSLWASGATHFLNPSPPILDLHGPLVTLTALPISHSCQL